MYPMARAHMTRAQPWKDRPLSWRRLFSPSSLAGYQDALRHLPRASRSAMSSQITRWLDLPLFDLDAFLWTPPSHANTAVTAKNIYNML